MPVVVYILPYIFLTVYWYDSNAPWYVDTYLAGINMTAMVAFFVDKQRAVNGEWRIPEVRLHLLTLAGGVLGSGAGMVLAHHKIRKLSFHAMYFVGVVTFCLIASALAPSASKAGANAVTPATSARNSGTSHQAHPHARHHVAGQHAS
jgi:uncharacterized membrane protein YsdA (DUF1294 family)